MSQKELRPDSASERGHREGSGRGVSTRHAPQRKRLEASAVVFVILISYAALLVPLGCFLAAAVAEVRSHKKGPAFSCVLGKSRSVSRRFGRLPESVSPSRAVGRWFASRFYWAAWRWLANTRRKLRCSAYCLEARPWPSCGTSRAPIMLSSLGLQCSFCSFCSFCLRRRPTGYFVILGRSARTASRSGQFRCQAGTNGSVPLFCFAVNLCP
jgi:hypothetical protein